MKKYFIIESSAKIYKRCFDYIALRDKNDKLIRKFVAKNITDRTDLTYATYWNRSFAIVLTDAEYEKFKSQLWKNYSVVENGRLCTFRKDSAVGKLYTKLDIDPAPKPEPARSAAIPSAQSHIFVHDGLLYCTIDSVKITEKTKFPDGWREITESEIQDIINIAVIK